MKKRAVKKRKYGGRAPSGKPKHSKVAKLKKLAKASSNNKSSRKSKKRR